MKYIMMLGVLLFSISCQANNDNEIRYPKYGGAEGKYSQCDPLNDGSIKNYPKFRVHFTNCKEGQYVFLLEDDINYSNNGNIVDAWKVPSYNKSHLAYMDPDVNNCIFKGEAPDNFYILGKDTGKVIKRFSTIDYLTKVTDIFLKITVDMEQKKLIPLENEIISCNVFHSDSY